MFKYNRLSDKLLKNQRIIKKNKTAKNSGNYFLGKLSEILSAVLNFLAFDRIMPFSKKKFFSGQSSYSGNLKSSTINNDYIIRFLVKFLKLSFAALLIILLWLGAEHIKHYMTTSKKFIISGVKINGCDIIPKNKIKKLYLDFCFSKGIPEFGNIFTFDINELHKFIIDRCNAIETLYISRNFDYSVGINITEKIPVGIIIGTEGKLKYIDSKLNIFDINDPSKTDYPALSVAGYNFDLSKKKADAAAAGLIQITNNMPLKIKNAASEIEYNNGNFIIYLKNGVKTLCYADNYSGRIDNIDIIISSFEEGYIDYIDLRFKNIYLMPKKITKEKKV